MKTADRIKDLTQKKRGPPKKAPMKVVGSKKNCLYHNRKEAPTNPMTYFFSAALVAGPTIPSATRPFFFWKSLIAVALCFPMMPSTVSL